jgi:single stranded DNA-binding protein
MATLNKVQLMGRLTSPPDAPRTLPNSGSTVVKFRMAVGRSRKNQQTGQWENDPNPLYIDCEVFAYPDAKRNLCDLVTRYVKQGDQIYLDGRLQLDEWDDKNGGGKRSKHKVVVENSPPMMATAIGPKKALRESGIIASTAAAAVSTMGRKRRTADSTIASQAGTPLARSCSIWSIKMTELR